MLIEKSGGIITRNHEILLSANRARLENPNFTATIVQLIALIIARPYGASILDVDLVTKRASTDMLSQIHLSLVSSTQVLCGQRQSSLKFLGCSTLFHKGASGTVIGCGSSIESFSQAIVHHH
jgi:hypothetical protein